MSLSSSALREAVAAATPPAHVLSIDVEEYFQVESAAAGLPQERWQDMPLRLQAPTLQILELLAQHKVRATFFVLGWVARREGDLVRRIARAGHEIASHGQSHRRLFHLDPRQFRQELRDSRAALQDLSGQAVVGYRAPTFSITHQTAWALDVLAEEGFSYDSSIFPVHHDRYGVPEAPRWAHRATGPAGGQVVEIPPLTGRLLGVNLPLAGGGYLRLLPAGWVGRALRSAAENDRWGMIYLHPWELDPAQPVLPMGRLSRWRHRVNLSRMGEKLRWLLGHFRFTCAREKLSAISAAELPSFSYGKTAG